jgi:hypothetical protein
VAVTEVTFTVAADAFFGMRVNERMSTALSTSSALKATPSRERAEIDFMKYRRLLVDRVIIFIVSLFLAVK